MARICREEGAHVSSNVRLAEMNIDVPVQDARRIEVIATVAGGAVGSRGRRRSWQSMPPSSSSASSPTRWSAKLSFAAARAFAASLLSLPLPRTVNVDGHAPDLSDVVVMTAGLHPRLPANA